MDYNCRDLSSFHPTCGSCIIIPGPASLYIYCPDCKVLAHVDQVGDHVTPNVALVSKAVPNG